MVSHCFETPRPFLEAHHFNHGIGMNRRYVCIHILYIYT